MSRISGAPPPLAPLPKPVETRQASGGPRNPVPVRNRADVDPQIRAAAEGMESMFMDYMLKTMRQTVQKSEMSLDNSATEIYQSMLDSEVAQKTARTNSVGLADQIIAYLESRSYNQKNGSSTEGRPSVRNLSAADTLQPKISQQESRQIESSQKTGDNAVQEVHHAGQSIEQP